MPPDQLLSLKRIIAAKTQATEGTFDTGVLAIAYAKQLKFEPMISYVTAQNERRPSRGQIGRPANVVGGRYGTLTFKAELRGSGTAGATPEIGVFLKACGMSETTNTGAEAIGAAVAARPGGNQGVSPSPVVTITTPAFNAKSGTLYIEIQSLTATNPEAAVFKATFYPWDGSTAIHDTFTFSDTDFDVTGAAGMSSLTLTVNDLDSGGLGLPVSTWAVGDRWRFNYASASQAEVAYTDTDTATHLSMAFYEDATVHKFHTCRGNFTIDAQTGAVPMITFNFMGCLVTSSGIADATFLTGIAYEDTRGQALVGATLEGFGSAWACPAGFSLDRGAQIEMLACAGAATGYEAARFTRGNGVTGKITGALAQLIATENQYARLFAGTVGGDGLTITHGTGSGGIVAITTQNIQIIGLTTGERAGHASRDYDLLCPIPEYDAGADYSAMTIRFQ